MQDAQFTMIVMPDQQLLLCASIAISIVWDIRNKNIYSASLMGALLFYVLYYIALDITNTFYHIPEFSQIDDTFVSVQIMVLSVFFLAFQGGRLSLHMFLRLARYNPRQNRLLPGQTHGRRTKGIAVLAPLTIGIILIVLTADGWWLFWSYPNNKGQLALFSLGGASVIATLMVLISVHRASSDQALRRSHDWSLACNMHAFFPGR